MIDAPKYQLSDVYDSAVFTIGSVYEVEGNTYVFLKGLDNTVVGSFVTFDELGVTTLLAKNAKGMVAVAMCAAQTDEYGFYQVKGKASGYCSAYTLDNALLFATATAGVASSGMSAGNRIKRAISRGANTGTAGLVDIQLDSPFMDDIDDAGETTSTSTTTTTEAPTTTTE